MRRAVGFSVTNSELALVEKPIRISDSDLMELIQPSKFDPQFVELGSGDSPLCLHCLAVDYREEGATETATEILRREGTGKVIVADATQLPLAANSIKNVVAKHFPVLSNRDAWTDLIDPKRIANRDLFLSEIYRVLKDDGRAQLLIKKHSKTVFDGSWWDLANFKTPELATAYQFSDIIRQARAIGFRVQIIVTDSHMGIVLEK